MAGPLEEQFKKMWNDTMEGAPPMLETLYEERTQLTPVERLDILFRLVGATRDEFLVLTREIDKLNAA